MIDAADTIPSFFELTCIRCDRTLRVRRLWIGREVECPYCTSLLRVPDPGPAARARALGPSLGARRLFNFPCPRCQVLLEAHTGMCGYSAHCPSCAARFVVPVLRGRRGHPPPAQLLDDADAAPSPVHAFAASGSQAPKLVRRPDGTSTIECPRCRTSNAVDSDRCSKCSTPFTMDSAESLDTIRGERRALGALVLGGVGLVLFPIVVPSALATLWGALNLLDPNVRRADLRSIAGLAMGVVGLLGAAAFWYAMSRP